MSTTVMIDSSDSESDYDDEKSLAIDDPIMCVLSKFLVNDAGENIAVILTNLITEIVLLRRAILATKGK